MGDKQNPQLLNCLESLTDGEITEQLQLLPGGDQISTIELHISKTHHIAVAGSIAEGFHARYREFSRAGEILARGQVSSVCCRIVSGQPLQSLEIPASLRAVLEQASTDGFPRTP